VVANRALAVPAFADWQDGRAGPGVTAAARFVVKLTQSPNELGEADVATAHQNRGPPAGTTTRVAQFRPKRFPFGYRRVTLVGKEAHHDK
jgi:hypothetical protein